jgi:exo-beta-1,3-glucanase (GH17 family)
MIAAGHATTKPVSLFTLAALTIAAAWWWLGAPVAMPPSPLAQGEKLHCVSYAPFRGSQSPLNLSTQIAPSQIDEDLAQLAQITDCVRTYSVDFGLENVPEIAQRHGLKVLLGLWVSSHADRTKLQIDTGIELARRFPDTIQSVIVGNEALLRGEVSADALAGLIATVKKQVAMPVTYADVWEFWLRHRQLEQVTDFVTVHILPYWEDEPIAAGVAADHIDSIRKRVAGEFPGREVLIGEVGWPSAGRMREGALPSPSAQARVMHDLLARAKAGGYRVNIIEAFDQPWKRHQEGTVGGHWGLITDPPRQRKFVWGESVSDHPHWLWQAAGGIGFAALVFGAAWRARRRSAEETPAQEPPWLAVAAVAAVSGVLVGWTVEAMAFEALGAGGWLRALAFAFVAAAAPLVGAAALARRIGPASFAGLVGPVADRTPQPLRRASGWLLLALTVLAVQSALGLAFNPRYLDFPFAPMTAALAPFVALALLARPVEGGPARAELAAGTVLALCALYIVWNETPSNWQALWLGGALVALAVILVRARAVRG